MTTRYKFTTVNPTNAGIRPLTGTGASPYQALTQALGKQRAIMFQRNTRKEQRPDALTYWARNGYFIGICECIETPDDYLMVEGGGAPQYTFALPETDLQLALL